MKSMYQQSQRKSKYGNKKVEFDGLKFDSIREKKRYEYLMGCQSEGLISDLKTHIKFELIPAVKEEYVEQLKTKTKIKTRTLQLPITYTCDFTYMLNGEYVVEDIKISPKTLPKEFVIKEKMMFALKGIRINKVYKYNTPIL